jgi:hypothetical protein
MLLKLSRGLMCIHWLRRRWRRFLFLCTSNDYRRGFRSKTFIQKLRRFFCSTCLGWVPRDVLKTSLKVPIKHYKVVVLRYIVRQPIMLSQKTKQLLTRSVNSNLCRMHLLIS